MNYSKTTDWRSHCEREQLQYSSAIQPFGALLFVRNADYCIAHASDNLAEYLKAADEYALGKFFISLDDVTRASLSALKLHQRMTQLILSGESSHPVAVTITALNDGWLMEFERESSVATSWSAQLVDLYSRMRQARQEDELNQLLITSLQRFSGFARVMIYRFDEEWNGEVIAEVAEQSLGSYLHLNFPASDIPAIARKLYEVNPWRYIPDANQQKRELRTIDPLSPLDLTYSELRSVSPMHMQYLLNMQVKSSFSIAIRLFDKLWGLVVCHHPAATTIPRSIRAFCYELVLKYRISLSEIITRENISRLDNHHRVVRAFLHAIPVDIDSEQLASHLLAYFKDRLQLSGVLIVQKQAMFLTGIDLPEETVHAIDDFLTRQPMGIWYTNSSRDYIPGHACIGVYAAGLAAINVRWVGIVERIIFFRAEQPSSVRWAGNPNKPVELLPDGGFALSPRNSFEIWVEEKRAQSLAWSKSDIALISHLQVKMLRNRA